MTEAQIISKKILAEYENTRIIKIEIYSPAIAQHYLPGQFVIIMVSEKGERVPLTIVETNLANGSINLIFQEIGYTTKLLGKLKEGDKLYHIVGPLGKPTEIKKFGNVLIIGGGVGTAEAYPVTKALKQQNNKITTILGARNKNLIILENEFKDISDEIYITTDDGSYGIKGFVTDVLEQLLKERTFDLVYAVGPVVMMKAVSNLTLPYNIPTIVSLNTIMVDGTGMCGSCRITYNGSIKYVCCDGPEFDGHKVDWDEIINRNKTYLLQEQTILKFIQD
ncbi:MAG: sulfide/dihydroorotate dehydrogenase-like FAD/NAD-binding protein [Endomicrobia bacterium]|nr:sulfide/dihydroorotate dehydrogenase-like FAD/NAD-binding protein [Endomicrobiia bacterium]MDW8056274.1 sulfide/dihydroorotate dehydrogenase-like FAD/NAD-binding protein [Elusimicrobiota bacterium]